MYAQLNTTHYLTVKLTGSKAGKYHYQIIEKATSQVVSERKSNRQYVAAIIPNGYEFYGRIDLAQKAIDKKKKLGYKTEVAYLEEKPPFDIEAGN